MRIALRLLATLLLLPLTSLADDRDYRIEQVKDNVYRFSAGHYHSVFMVADDKVFVTDPIDAAAASYLKQQIAQRFNKPIRYLEYSHNHIDHTLGGDVIADSRQVEVIAHEYAAEDLEWTKAPTALPTQTFNDHLTIKLGDSWVELSYFGPNNGRGNVSMRFMPANVMFVADWVVIGRMPYQDLPGYDIHGMIRSTQALLQQPAFDVFVGAHAQMGTVHDVQYYLNYLQDLYAAVRDGMLAGKSLSQLQQDIRLQQYQQLAMYEQWLPLNIEGVYRTLNDMSYFDRR